MSEDNWLKSDYDDISERVRLALKAVGVIVIVFEGKHGTDASFRLPEQMHPRLPALLRKLAAGIEEQYQRKHGPQIICPVCQGEFMRFESTTTPGEKPGAGDMTICAGCATFLRFTSETTLRIAETEEIAEMTDDERNTLVRVRREIERRRR